MFLYTEMMQKLLGISGGLAIGAGIILVLGGAWGAWFTATTVARERIVTPADASIPNAPVKGPFTLNAQADIIRTHTLRMTDGKTFAEMPREIPKLDEAGNQVVDEAGRPVMAPNTARDIWITATTLITALNLGLITYAFSGLIILFGCVSVWTGITFLALRKSLGARPAV